MFCGLTAGLWAYYFLYCVVLESSSGSGTGCTQPREYN
jgi:hypothetical protein